MEEEMSDGRRLIDFYCSVVSMELEISYGCENFY